MWDNVSVVICDARIWNSISVSTIYRSPSAVFSSLISVNNCMSYKIFGKSFHAALAIPTIRLVAAIMDHIANNQWSLSPLLNCKWTLILWVIWKVRDFCTYKPIAGSCIIRNIAHMNVVRVRTSLKYYRLKTSNIFFYSFLKFNWSAMSEMLSHDMEFRQFFEHPLVFVDEYSI